MATTNVTVEELNELGFSSAAKKVNESKELVRKTAIAYEHFDYITPEMVEKFKDELRKKTLKSDHYTSTYDTLKFTPVDQYPEVPPKEALLKLREAKGLKCFDYFEIAKIESVTEVKDPILFGRIKECGDLFFICQWDDDVTIEAIKAASK